MSWEQWFKDQSISAVRSKLKELEFSIDNEALSTQNQIGAKYPDILALADRLASLQSLSSELESKISNFGRGQQMNLPPPFQQKGVLYSNIYKKLTTLLVSLIERALLQSRYTLAARTLYLARVLNIESPRLSDIHQRMASSFRQLLVSAPQLSRDIYDADMIFHSYTPARFLQRFLELRILEIHKLIDQSVAQVFTLVDTTTFIHDQVVSDLGLSRLTQRKLVDLADFSDPLLASLLQRTLDTSDNASTVTTRTAKAYPAECYAANNDEMPMLEPFLSEVGKLLESKADGIFNGLSCDEMVGRFAAIIQQAQSAFSSKTSQAKLLDSLQSAFAKQLVASIKTVCALPQEELEAGVSKVRLQIEHLTKLARQVTSFAPNLKAQLEDLSHKSKQEIANMLEKRFKKEVAELTDSSLLNKLFGAKLRDCTKNLRVLQDKVSVYSRLGGPRTPIPSQIYEAIARALVVEMNEDSKKESGICWGDSRIARIWAMQKILDKEPVEHWDRQGLQAIRNFLATSDKQASEEASEAGKRTNSTEAVSITEQAKPEHDAESYKSEARDSGDRENLAEAGDFIKAEASRDHKKTNEADESISDGAISFEKSDSSDFSRSSLLLFPLYIN